MPLLIKTDIRDLVDMSSTMTTEVYGGLEGISNIIAPGDLNMTLEYNPVIKFTECKFANFNFSAIGPVCVVFKDVQIEGNCCIKPCGVAVLFFDDKTQIGGNIIGWTNVSKI